MIYRPTPEQIHDFMMNTFRRILPRNHLEHINSYLFICMPRDLDTLSTSMSRNIICKWLELIDNKAAFNVYDWLKKFQLGRYYLLNSENLYTYDWYALLSICSENNLIVDSIYNNNLGAVIYDIGLASERLKVRI